jgi:3-deoxy-D-manno-octulosonate 8-phosphate phosphatase KdsC-like HAD superfamily phosphatase
VVWLWVVGVVLLVAAGFVVTYLPRVRARTLRRRTAWSTAHAAIDSAAISRDGASGDVPTADELLTRAQLLAAHHGGLAAAREAADCAARADRLYQEAAGE